MADKIVQLQNKAGDNIYPISRGIAANSVDTAALKDSSVTAAKLANSAVTLDKIASSALPENVYVSGKGYAIKYPDGTLIQYCTFVSGEVTTDPTYGAWTWSFPVQFTSYTPTVFCMPTRGDADYAMYIPRYHQGGRDYAQFIFTKTTSTGVAPATNATLNNLSVYAIGKWK